MKVNARRHLVVALSLGAAALAASPASAETSTGTLPLSVTVQYNCSISTVTGVEFGTYSSGQSENLDAAGSIGYEDCPAAATVDLDPGQGPSSSVADRRLSNGSNTLSYALYTDSGRSTAWGENAVAVPNGGTGSIPVYGRIAGGQMVLGGTYADTVGITITF